MKNNMYSDVARKENSYIFIRSIYYLFCLAFFGLLGFYLKRFIDDSIFDSFFIVIYIVVELVFVFNILFSLLRLKSSKKHSVQHTSFSLINQPDFLSSISLFNEIKEKVIDDEIENDKEKEVTINQPINVNVKNNIDFSYEDQGYSFEKVFNDFLEYSKANGLEIDKETALNFFSCMASSRFIFTYYEDVNLLYRFMEIVIMFFQANYSSVNFGFVNEIEDLFYTYDSYSDYSKSIMKNSTNRQFTFNIFYNVDLERFAEKCGFILDFANNYNEDYVLKINSLSGNDFVELLLNKKVFNIIFVDKEFDMYSATEDFTKFATNFIPKNLKYSSSEIMNYDNYNISNSWFEDVLRESLDQNLIDERNWKKLDELEKVLIENKRTFDNKMWLQFEKYTTLFLTAGESEETAIDNLLSFKIIPYMNSVKKDYKDSSLYLIIESLFGSENILKSNEILKKIKN